MKNYMDLAILEALKSGWNGYIPIGGCIVQNNNIIGFFHNKYSIEHTEIFMRNYIFHNNLKNIYIYITMEPCIMCWFLLNRLYKYVKKIIFGVFNKKYGGISNHIQWAQKKYIPYEANINKDKILILLKGYFYFKRENIKTDLIKSY